MDLDRVIMGDSTTVEVGITECTCALDAGNTTLETAAATDIIDYINDHYRLRSKELLSGHSLGAPLHWLCHALCSTEFIYHPL